MFETAALSARLSNGRRRPCRCTRTGRRRRARATAFAGRRGPAQRSRSDVSGAAGAALYYLLDANIPTGSQTLAITFEPTPNWTTDEWAGQIYTLCDVNQTSPVQDSSNDRVSAAVWDTVEVTTVDDSLAITAAGVATGISGASDITETGYTNDRIYANTGGGAVLVGSKPVTTGATEGAAIDWDGNSEIGGHVLGVFAPASSVCMPCIRYYYQMISD